MMRAVDLVRQVQAASEPSGTDRRDRAGDSVERLRALVAKKPVRTVVDGTQVRVEVRTGAIAVLVGPTEIRFWLESNISGSGARLIIGDLGRYAPRPYFSHILEDDDTSTPQTLLRAAVRTAVFAAPRLAPSLRELAAQKYKAEAAAEPQETGSLRTHPAVVKLAQDLGRFGFKYIGPNREAEVVFNRGNVNVEVGDLKGRTECRVYWRGEYMLYWVSNLRDKQVAHVTQVAQRIADYDDRLVKSVTDLKKELFDIAPSLRNTDPNVFRDTFYAIEGKL